MDNLYLCLSLCICIIHGHLIVFVSGWLRQGRAGDPVQACCDGEEICWVTSEEVFLTLKNGYTKTGLSSAGGVWVCVCDSEELAVML